MVKSTWIKKGCVALVIIIINLLIIYFMPSSVSNENFKLQYKVTSNQATTYQVFYSKTEEFDAQHVESQNYEQINQETLLTYSLPQDIQYIRLDLGEKSANIQISQIELSYYNQKANLTSLIKENSLDHTNQIESIEKENDIYHVIAQGEDPYIIVALNNIPNTLINQGNHFINLISKSIFCIIFDIIAIILYKKYAVIKELSREVYKNRTLVWNLSKNDFKTKYAGSYLGITWAFVQPIVTVLVYWFVFQVGFRSGDVGDFPFVLWLVTGIVPWFFFSDALMNATNSMMEYSYLVKKVVFKISILPIVKIISALFVHLFFIGFTILLYLCYGYNLNAYMLQVIYYTVCTFILTLGISYATCAIIVFFKDLGQIISIFLQIGMWLTPIMWNYEMIGPKYRWILKLNPMYYIVEGYRDSLINKVWFWNRYNQTIYFWIVAITIFVAGTIIFKKLKVHFADVL